MRTKIIIRQVKYLNNIVEQDHRGVKRVTRPMLGFKSFDAAQGTLAGIELMHMIKKKQMVVEPARRTVFCYATYLAGGLPLLAAVYGATAGRLRYRLVPVDVPMAHLPPSLDGLCIVHLSDLHIGDFMPRAAIRRAVDLANTVQPDLAVLTGDLITNDRDPLEDCIEELSRLRAPLGIWGCHGNHERSARVEARAQALFARYGMHLLRQECMELPWCSEDLASPEHRLIERRAYVRRLEYLSEVRGLVRVHKDEGALVLHHPPRLA